MMPDPAVLVVVVTVLWLVCAKAGVPPNTARATPVINMDFSICLPPVRENILLESTCQSPKPFPDTDVKGQKATPPVAHLLVGDGSVERLGEPSV
jgi:hypothetical protein